MQELRVYESDEGFRTVACTRHWDVFLSRVVKHDAAWKTMIEGPHRVVLRLPCNWEAAMRLTTFVRNALGGIRPRAARGGRLGLVDLTSGKLVASATSWKRLEIASGIGKRTLFRSHALGTTIRNMVVVGLESVA